MDDALYGMIPNETESFGPNLGALAPRGERNVLITSLDALLRVASNPFFPYLVQRIQDGIDHPASPPAKAGTMPAGLESKSGVEPSLKDAAPVLSGSKSTMDDPSDLPP